MMSIKTNLHRLEGMHIQRASTPGAAGSVSTSVARSVSPSSPKWSSSLPKNRAVSWLQAIAASSHCLQVDYSWHWQEAGR